MAADPHRLFMSVEEYLAFDRSSMDARYEFIDGIVTMLAGGTVNHSRICVNLIVALNSLLRGKSCMVYNSDMRMGISATRYVYPDVTVTCDPRDEAPEDSKTHYPTVVIEVLSPSTETTDRGKKLLYYQAHPTIQDYMMADSQSILIEVYHREKSRWTFSTYKLEDEAPLVLLC